MKSTIVSASTPNPLAFAGGAGLFPGAESGAVYVRFGVTQDRLQILSLKEISNNPDWTAQLQRTPEVVDSWPVTNVDLKYRVNLDGEKTNFYEENQELDWQVRQWVKINFAKNDMNDLNFFGGNLNPILANCTAMGDAATTLVPNSFKVDETNQTWEYTINLTVPISYTSDNAATCAAAFGPGMDTFFQLDRHNVSMNIRTIFVRPDHVIDSNRGNVASQYVPMPLAEKDPIRRKYGAFETLVPFRDSATQLVTANTFVNRFDPNKDIVYYFAPGMPEVYRKFFLSLADATNKNVLQQVSAKGTLKFLNYNDASSYGDGAGPVREYGDPRYSFVNWHSDLDNGSGLLGVGQHFTDPRTGEILSASVNVFEGAFKDTVQQRLDLYLQTVGAEFLQPDGNFDDSKYPSGCQDGDLVPLIPADVAKQLNRQSTVYGKIQGYLQRPYANYGYLGPKDFLPTHDPDFYNAYFAVLPYQVYADPQSNPFVTPDGTTFPAPATTDQWASLQKIAQFNTLAAQIDHGVAPYDTAGPDAIKAAVDFQQKWNDLALAVTDYEHSKRYLPRMNAADDISMFSYMDVYQKNGRHCVGGKWESRQDYVDHLTQSLNMAVAAHEFGHTLGLRHNFMGSVDQRNFPLDSKKNPMLYSSSLMDYNQPISEAFFDTAAGSPLWGSHDMAALGWIYGNNQSSGSVGPVAKPQGATSSTASGQVSTTAPWNDKLGFSSDGKTETQFLFCTDQHTKYTPLCRPYDLGVTPSEIIANQLQSREWNYLWTNFRLYHKYHSNASYAQSVANDFNELRRFQTQWLFDWSGGELTNTLRLIGTQVPPGSNAADYYAQLTNKFNTDISMANQLAATYHRAIVEQSSGERPFITIFDPFFGDTTQQGIQVDKVTATGSITTLWPAISNFDPSQAGAFYVTSVGNMLGDTAYQTVSTQVLADFLGAAFATYHYAQLGPLAQFAAATHSPLWSGDLKFQGWVGGYAFNRERDFLDFIHSEAVKAHFSNCDENGLNCDPCTSLDHCNWDPRTLQAKSNNLTQSDRFNRFQSPTGRTYIWGYIRSRNQWILADKDKNVATYTLMLGWTQDVVNGEDDGNNGASNLEYNVRYIVDAFTYYDQNTLAQ
jgi:hypothetical protein